MEVLDDDMDVPDGTGAVVIDEVPEVVDVPELVNEETRVADDVAVDADVNVVEETVTVYSCNLEPAPQYCSLFPGQRNLQSFWLVAATLPADRVFPQ